MAALEIFASAADLCAAASAPLREAAGVHALDGRWDEAGRLARAAVHRDREDEHAWRILATSAYVGGDPAAALAAWNAIGEPVVDLVTVQGLTRTRHSAATTLLGLEANTQLTTGRLAAAAHRLASLPSAEAARVKYQPIGGGRANVEALVVERPRFPTTRTALLSAAVGVATDRELSVRAASLSGGGDLVTARWRWWEARPRISLVYETPAGAGVWRAEVFTEKQTYGDGAAASIQRRRGGALALSNWTTTLLRWQVGAGIDSWADGERTVSFGGELEQRLRGDAVSLYADARLLTGAFDAWTAGTGLAWRSRARHEGTVLAGSAGVEATAQQAPLALWPGAGTGHGRSPLLRAHPLLERGRITGAVFGRRLYHASVEGRRWLRPVMQVLRIAPAVFVDVARADRRRASGTAWHADAGVGLRIALPGSGVLRLDVGRGLRDGATAVSAGWTR